MINRSKQAWTVGSTVKVGFMSLVVVAAVATPGDFAPDAYVLSSTKCFYKFVPHNGLVKLTAVEAQDLIAEGQRVAAQQAAAAIANAATTASHGQLLANLLKVA
ncbi:hypothetical protein J7E70_02015 [Variovorax paradoxus]|nr:hypothetical protein [Variovorax paradoxus]MBT2299230.1 hypothetical protein [Variovorax paradoxus]